MIAPPQPSARAFVDSHAGEVPPALIARVQSVLAAQGGEPQSAAAALLAASTTLLAGVLGDARAGREVALDLLAADACVTWAFESAAGDTADISTLAEDAMQQIAALAK